MNGTVHLQTRTSYIRSSCGKEVFSNLIFCLFWVKPKQNNCYYSSFTTNMSLSPSPFDCRAFDLFSHETLGKAFISYKNSYLFNWCEFLDTFFKQNILIFCFDFWDLSVCWWFGRSYLIHIFFEVSRWKVWYCWYFWWPF